MMLKGLLVRWFGLSAEEPAARVGGGGASPDPGLPHECPPAARSGGAIAPGVNRPDWPTLNYIRDFGYKIGELRDQHPELYEQWNAYMQDYLSTDKMGRQPEPSPELCSFVDRHKHLLDPGEA